MPERVSSGRHATMSAAGVPERKISKAGLEHSYLYRTSQAPIQSIRKCDEEFGIETNHPT